MGPWKMLREVTATRYIEPLRSGGSVPGVVEADDLGTYVVKLSTQGALTCGDASIPRADLPAWSLSCFRLVRA